MDKKFAMIFAVGVYAMFIGVSVYGLAFLLDIGGIKTINSGQTETVGLALAIDLGLIAAFGLVHGFMARPAFKALAKRIVPAHMERTVHVLVANLMLIALFWQWRPIDGVVWQVEHPAGLALVAALFVFGLAFIAAGSSVLGHFSLVGVQQVKDHVSGRAAQPERLVTGQIQEVVRHPQMVGFMLVIWAAPTMSAGHLLFAVATTLYIALAIQLEERDLLARLGDRYWAYQRQVPMIIPVFSGWLAWRAYSARLLRNALNG